MQKGNTALMTAASNGHTKIVKYLVEETTVQINATNNVSHVLWVQEYGVEIEPMTGKKIAN